MSLERGCEQADEAGMEVVVEAGQVAVPFYRKYVLELKAQADMPRGFGHHKYVLVRPVKK